MKIILDQQESAIIVIEQEKDQKKLVFQNIKAEQLMAQNDNTPDAFNDSVDIPISLSSRMFKEIYDESEGPHTGVGQSTKNDSAENDQLRGLDQIIDDLQLKYKNVVYSLRNINKGDIELETPSERQNDEIFYQFKRKTYNNKGKNNCLLTITDISDQINYKEAQRENEMLNQL